MSVATLVGLMVVTVVLGAAAAGLVIVSRTPAAPASTAGSDALRAGRQFTATVGVYDGGNRVQDEAVWLASLGNEPSDRYPEIVREQASSVEDHRSLAVDQRFDELVTRDREGADLLDRLRGQGYQPSDAVLATLGGADATTIAGWRAGRGADPAALAIYERARRELYDLDSQTPARLQALNDSLRRMETDPPAGDAPGPNPWALASIALVVVAVQLGMALALVRAVRRRDDASVQATAELTTHHDAQLESLFLVARRLTGSLPAGSVAATVAEEACWTTGAHFAAVAVVDDEWLVPVAFYGDIAPDRARVGDGVAGRCAEAIQPQSATVPGEPMLPFESGPLSLVATPMLTGRTLAAVLLVGCRVGADVSPGESVTGTSSTGFSSTDRTALQLLSHVGGAALEGSVLSSATAMRAFGALPAGNGPYPEWEPFTRSGPITGPPPNVAPTDDPAVADPADPAVADPAVDADTAAGLSVTSVASTSGEPSAATPTTEPRATDRAPIERIEREATTATNATSDQDADLPRTLAGRAAVVRLLSPDLEVWRNGATVKLPGAGARILAVLVAQRQPVTVDRLADLLWPEIDLDAGRNRLNVTVHRLRKALDIRNDELLVRSTDGIALVPGTEWTIDGWLFADLAASAAADDRRTAFDLYRADLCSRQFAYDEALLTERRRLHALWVDLTVGLLSRGPTDHPPTDHPPTGDGDAAIDPRLAADRALRFAPGGAGGMGDDELFRVLGDALDGAGHAAQADVLRAIVVDGRHLA